MKKMIFLDFDGTLYEKDNPLTRLIDSRVTRFLMKQFDGYSQDNLVDLEKRYPNILQVLSEYRLNKEEYRSFVYGGIDYNCYINRDEKLINLLKKVNIRKTILSLSPETHLCCAMKALDIKEYIDDVISMFDDDYMDKSEKILSLLRKNKFTKDETIVIGDSWINDLQGAFVKNIDVCKIGSNEEMSISGYRCFNNIYDCLETLLNESFLI